MWTIIFRDSQRGYMELRNNILATLKSWGRIQQFDGIMANPHGIAPLAALQWLNFLATGCAQSYFFNILFHFMLYIFLKVLYKKYNQQEWDIIWTSLCNS